MNDQRKQHKKGFGSLDFHMEKMNVKLKQGGNKIDASERRKLEVMRNGKPAKKMENKGTPQSEYTYLDHNRKKKDMSNAPT